MGERIICNGILVADVRKGKNGLYGSEAIKFSVGDELFRVYAWDDVPEGEEKDQGFILYHLNQSENVWVHTGVERTFALPINEKKHSVNTMVANSFLEFQIVRSPNTAIPKGKKNRSR